MFGVKQLFFKKCWKSFFTKNSDRKLHTMKQQKINNASQRLFNSFLVLSFFVVAGGNPCPCLGNLTSDVKGSKAKVPEKTLIASFEEKIFRREKRFPFINLLYQRKIGRENSGQVIGELCSSLKINSLAMALFIKLVISNLN